MSRVWAPSSRHLHDVQAVEQLVGRTVARVDARHPAEQRHDAVRRQQRLTPPDGVDRHGRLGTPAPAAPRADAGSSGAGVDEVAGEDEHRRRRRRRSRRARRPRRSRARRAAGPRARTTTPCGKALRAPDRRRRPRRRPRARRRRCGARAGCRDGRPRACPSRSARSARPRGRSLREGPRSTPGTADASRRDAVSAGRSGSAHARGEAGHEQVELGLHLVVGPVRGDDEARAVDGHRDRGDGQAVGVGPDGLARDEQLVAGVRGVGEDAPRRRARAGCGSRSRSPGRARGRR